MRGQRLAIFASGSGSTAELVLKFTSLVITNNPEAGIIQRARKNNVPVEIISRIDYKIVDSSGKVDKEKTSQKFGRALLKVLNKHKIDFIGQHGWSLLTPKNVVQKFKGKIINSHPGPLDPGYNDFGGKGMHGLAVHAAVLNFHKLVSGKFNKTEVTLHFVTEEYDKGELVMLSDVDILKDDTPEGLQERVKEIEKVQNKLFWEKVLKKGEITPIKRTKRLILPSEEKILNIAKNKAIEGFS